MCRGGGGGTNEQFSPSSHWVIVQIHAYYVHFLAKLSMKLANMCFCYFGFVNGNTDIFLSGDHIWK